MSLVTGCKLLTFVLLMCVSQVGLAGAYIFAGEANGTNVITHPNTYSGSESEVVVRICIDPESANAGAMEIPIQNNINIFNKLEPTIGNVNPGNSGQIDFESVALHEIGHCVGMAHVNLASESGLTGVQTNYTKSTDGANNGYDIAAGADGKIGSKDDVRGDDVNLHWFRKSNNDPFTIDNVIDKTTYSVDLADLPPTGGIFAANADRGLSTFLGLPKTEAVMQQGTYSNEAQRTLGHDDVATISYAASGLDEQAGTSDDYTLRLEYGGISSTDCNVSLSFTSTTGLAFCETGGQFIGQRGPNGVDNHTRITTASIEFGSGFNWYFNQETVNQAPVITAIDDQVLLEQEILQINITSSDADGDALVITAVGLPAFANLVDNGDGTAIVTVSPQTGDESISQVTLMVTDDGLPNVSTQEVFQLIVTLDSDNDGLTDYDEINEYQTLPDNPDTDGDFISDGEEVNNGSNPNDDTSWPNYADGDVAPLGAPDGLVNAADYLIVQRISLGKITATSLELSHGDLFPPGSPDGVIDTSDLILLLELIQ